MARSLEGSSEAWKWQEQGEGWLFAATWLLFGPPVMVRVLRAGEATTSLASTGSEASADVLLGLDLASITDKADVGIGEI